MQCSRQLADLPMQVAVFIAPLVEMQHEVKLHNVLLHDTKSVCCLVPVELEEVLVCKFVETSHAFYASI